jgi:hypothetical protein
MNPNGIKKNDHILVLRDNGETILGIATKVAPWSKNPKITVVNYNFTDKKDGLDYTSKADARRCTMAPADMLPKEAETHPIMAKWSLGKTKRGPEMMEGHYYDVSVFLNGKNVGKIVDEGNGGSCFLRFKDHTVAMAFNADCEAWCKANGDDSDSEFPTEFWAWWDESKPKGKDAATYFKEKKEQFAKWLASK